MRKSFRSPASLPWFFDVFCVLRQSRIHEEQSLFEGIVKSQQKGESTPVAASELARILYGAIVWTSCAAQLRFCCCLTEGQQQHSFMVFGMLGTGTSCSLSRKGLLDSLSLREMPKKVGLVCFCTGTTQLRRCYSNGPTRQGLISEMA